MTKSFDLYDGNKIVIRNLEDLKDKIIIFMQDILCKQMSKQEIDNLRFGVDMSKGVYHFKKVDETQNFEVLLEDLNFWECFEGNEIKVMLMYRNMKY